MRDTISKELAEQLALDYGAFHRKACATEDDREGLRLWARMLLKSQERTGIELVSERDLFFYINRR